MHEIGDEKYEELRKLLEDWRGRQFTLEQAKSIGNGLIDFYTVLATPNSESDDTTKMNR